MGRGPLFTVRGLAWCSAILLVLVYCASIAAAGPWDPWETHYGEVARQILVRHDPLDLWWRPGNGGPDGEAENTFWSKPALPFWLMALSMKLFGVGTGADPAEMVRPVLPEVALRLPGIVVGLGTCAVLGGTVARLATPRAGLLTALVLATTPQWALVTRQALTDVYFVAPVSLALAAWAFAVLAPDRELRRRRLGRVTLPWDRAYLLFLLVLVVSALVPLAVLQAHVFDPYTVQRVSRFAKRPGIPNLLTLRAIFEQLFVYWVLALGVLAASLRWRRRSQAVLPILYLMAGVSVVGKGFIGPGLVGFVVLLHLVVSGRWDWLRRAGLPTGILCFLMASMPWHHAMWLYRGDRWFNELIVQNNVARFTAGEQKQAVGGVGYYVQTLAVSALPWIALLPAAFMAALGRPGAGASEAGTPASEVRRFALLWGAASLWVITFSVTKYYHYAIPVLPPLAVLVGLWLDDVWTRGSRGGAAVVLGAVTAATVLAFGVRDAIHEPAWIAHLTTYLYTGMWKEGAPATWRLGIAAAPFVVGLALLVARRGRAAVVGIMLSGILTTAWVINDYVPAASESWSQRTALRTYYAQRGPHDRLVSWWFYYRGETYFTKGDVWVMKETARDPLKQLLDETAGKDASVWFITTVSHARRLDAQLPGALRGKLETVYESFHYTLLRVRVP